MRLTLRDFQSEAVEALADHLDTAWYGFRKSSTLASVILAAPTGAGKTVIATALVERIFFGTDDGTDPADPDAVFLWMTDMPNLNTQTCDKMLEGSSLLGPNRLVVIENTFDAETLDAGRVYFLNTQKLGARAALAGEMSPKRHYPFWETVANTIAAPDLNLYLVIDEAHRGMTEAADVTEASAIIQRFIKGIDNVMPPVPVVIGISATPERFNRVVETAGRTTASHVVKPEAVRASGLIKDRTIAHVAGEHTHDPMALLGVAATAFRDSSDAWTAYCAGSGDTPVVPALIVQVENEDATDLAEAIDAITGVVGPLPESAFAHSFGEGRDITVGLRTIRYVKPDRISLDPEIRVVFFKMSLGTGWDCPRAEVMFSFRRAVDLTTIAQTLGRMVRAPLARRIETDDRLNEVSVFLPHYDRANVDAIVAYLAETGGDAVPLVSSADLATLSITEEADIVAAIRTVPTYEVPTIMERREIRRLTDLARALSAHGIDPDADAREKAWIAKSLLDAYRGLAGDVEFAKEVADEGEIEIERIEWVVGGDAGKTTRSVINASEGAINAIFAAAKRILGGEAAEAYWKARVAEDVTAIDRGRLEAYALAVRQTVMDQINVAASRRIDALFQTHGAAIAALSPGKRAVYDRVRKAAPKPTQGYLSPPTTIVRAKGATTLSKHLFADAAGGYEVTLNGWETEALVPRLADDHVLAWLRNLPTDPWALRIPWTSLNVAKPFYPDFLVVRRERRRLVLDILDPHDHTRDDAPGKARGLSAYARDHGALFGHVDLMAKIDGRMRVLHLETEVTRNAVDAITDNAGLIALYRQA